MDSVEECYSCVGCTLARSCATGLCVRIYELLSEPQLLSSGV
jgi:hypothetical protein